MAATVLARDLTDRYRLQQLEIRRQTLARLAVTMPLLDVADVDATFAQWSIVAGTVLQAGRESSAALGLGYYEGFRLLELERPAPARVSALAGEPVAMDPAHTLAVLRITGPITVKQAQARGAGDTALQAAYVRTARAVGSLTLQAGRERVDSAIRADARCIGWQRVTGARACSFCAMLADRGAVYKEDTVGFETHAHCGCSGEPVFRDVDNAFPPAPPSDITEDSGAFDAQLLTAAA